jgi:hypothetical protein
MAVLGLCASVPLWFNPLALDHDLPASRVMDTRTAPCGPWRLCSSFERARQSSGSVTGPSPRACGVIPSRLPPLEAADPRHG